MGYNQPDDDAIGFARSQDAARAAMAPLVAADADQASQAEAPPGLLALPADALAHVARFLDASSSAALARCCRAGRALLPGAPRRPWCCGEGGACGAARAAQAGVAGAPPGGGEGDGEAPPPWMVLYPAARESTALAVVEALAARGRLRPAAFARVCDAAEHEDLAGAVGSCALVVSIDRGRASLRSVCRSLGVRTPIVGLISEKLAQLPHEGALVDRVLLPTLATMGALPLVFEASGAPSGYESYFVPWREEGGNGGGDGAAGGSTDCGVLFSGNSHPEPFACELHSYR